MWGREQDRRASSGGVKGQMQGRGEGKVRVLLGVVEGYMVR